jgi:hypothetical protein
MDNFNFSPSTKNTNTNIPTPNSTWMSQTLSAFLQESGNLNFPSPISSINLPSAFILPSPLTLQNYTPIVPKLPKPMTDFSRFNFKI